MKKIYWVGIVSAIIAFLAKAFWVAVIMLGVLFTIRFIMKKVRKAQNYPGMWERWER